MGKAITRNNSKKRPPPNKKEPKFGFSARELDRKAKTYQRRHDGVDYPSALKAVAGRYPELYERYRNEAPLWRDVVFDDLAELADFLNEGGKQADKLLDLIKPVLNWNTTPQEVVKEAAMKMAVKLNEIQTQYVPIFAGKRPLFARTSGEKGYWGIVSNAVAAGQLSRLRSCHYCGTFFVTKNKNIYLCPEKECRKNHMRKQAREGMVKIRNLKKEETARSALANLAKLIGEWKISGLTVNWLGDDLENKGISRNSIKAIVDGVEKRWEAVKILGQISPQGRTILANMT